MQDIFSGTGRIELKQAQSALNCAYSVHISSCVVQQYKREAIYRHVDIIYRPALVHTQHTSYYKARAVAEEGILKGLAYSGKAQWCACTCMHSIITPNVPGYIAQW